MRFSRRLIWLSFSVIIFLLILAPVTTKAVDSGPTVQLKASVDTLLKVLRDESLKGAENSDIRRERIAEVVFMQFDMRRMAKLSLGRGWRKLSEAEREHFVGLFRKLLSKSYIATIDGYSGEKISYVKEIIKGNKAEVRTMVIGNAKEIALTYKLKLDDSRWLIYDVIIENVSLVRNYRSQFDPIMKKEGFTGLVKRMEERIAVSGAKKDG
jgi:phospholipid transport system substrate-binding protein